MCYCEEEKKMICYRLNEQGTKKGVSVSKVQEGDIIESLNDGIQALIVKEYLNHGEFYRAILIKAGYVLSGASGSTIQFLLEHLEDLEEDEFLF